MDDKIQKLIEKFRAERERVQDEPDACYQCGRDSAAHDAAWDLAVAVSEAPGPIRMGAFMGTIKSVEGDRVTIDDHERGQVTLQVRRSPVHPEIARAVQEYRDTHQGES